MTETLDVYFNNELAGFLTKEKNSLSFIYNDDYCSDPKAQPISASMKDFSQVYGNDISEAFFQGLLPDEGVKKAIARILQTDETNTFRLLQELGGDCAGAIAIYPKNITPNNCLEPKYKEIEDEQAFEILTSLKKRPLYIGEDDFRISGAGAQDKLVACIFDGKLSLPLQGTPSTHIIKPNIEGFNDTTYNELFCMKLAKLCGLETPSCFIKKINNVPFYAVERYDRNLKDKFWSRIHQEDFCQILKILPQNKYESDGGPNFKSCFELLNDIGVPATSKIAFLDLIIFNYLIGNGDAHGKNFSIIYKNNIPELAPCYDLVCTAILAPHYSKANIAMKLNSKKYLMSKVNREKFEQLSETSGFRKDYILKRLDNMCDKININAPELAKSLNLDINTQSTVYDEIIKIIKLHSSKIAD